MSVEIKQDAIVLRERLAQILPKDTSPNFSSMPSVKNTLIVESGSNANGNWTKYEDGTMIQWGHVETLAIVCNQIQDAIGFRSNNNIKTYPVAFVGDLPIVSMTSANAVTSGIPASFSNKSLTAVGVYLCVVNLGTYDLIYDWQAIGRWK